MLKRMKFVALFSFSFALAMNAQTVGVHSSTSPVARVYVTRPTHLDAFNVSSTGKLTAVPGSPFSNISLSHLSINKKYLFGASDDGNDIITYSLESNGAVKKVAEIDAEKYCDDTTCYSACGPVGPTQLDHTGATLYNYQDSCDDTAWTQAFQIESNGTLKYLNRVPTTEDLSMTPTVILGNNGYAYNFGSSFDNPGTQSFIFKRGGNGALAYADSKMTFPKPEGSGDVFDLDKAAATDPTNHIVVALYEVNQNTGYSAGPYGLFSYTADSKGNLTTTNTLKNAPTPELNSEIGTMSISPSAKLLAIGGGPLDTTGFQIFHFNGASPITKFTDVLHSSEVFLEFGWDNSNHLFALSNNALHIYSATSTSIKEVEGSPISIPEASSLIVQSLN